MCVSECAVAVVVSISSPEPPEILRAPTSAHAGPHPSPPSSLTPPPPPPLVPPCISPWLPQHLFFSGSNIKPQPCPARICEKDFTVRGHRLLLSNKQSGTGGCTTLHPAAPPPLIPLSPNPQHRNHHLLSPLLESPTSCGPM